MQEIVDRIEKDIAKFRESAEKLNDMRLSEKEQEIFELAKDYCSDSETWLKKKDTYTAFASISYAHGLLDSLMKLRGAQ